MPSVSSRRSMVHASKDVRFVWTMPMRPETTPARNPEKPNEARIVERIEILESIEILEKLESLEVLERLEILENLAILELLAPPAPLTAP